MNKVFKILLILLLSFIALGLSLGLYILIKKDFHFNSDFFNNIGRESTTLLDSKEFDEVSDIYINSNIADVYIKNAENDKIRVELYSDNAKTHNISLSNNDLKIELEESNKNIFIGKQPRIILYVPNDFENKFDITNITGDIEASEYLNASFKIKVTSGDVRIDKANVLDISTRTGDIKNNQVNSAVVECTTGDIRLGNVNSDLNLKTTTGDIRIDAINLLENSNIQTTTGDVRINSKGNVYVETETKTGDVKINNNDRFAEIVLHIKVTTGDIEVG